MKAKDWQDKLMDIEARMERHGSAHVTYLNEGIPLLEISQQVLERYKECERVQKRRILNLVLSNSIWMNGEMIPQYREIQAPLAVMKSGERREARRGRLRNPCPGCKSANPYRVGSYLSGP